MTYEQMREQRVIFPTKVNITLTNDRNSNEPTLNWTDETITSFNLKAHVYPLADELPYIEFEFQELYKGDVNELMQPIDYLDSNGNWKVKIGAGIEIQLNQYLDLRNTWANVKTETWQYYKTKTWNDVKTPPTKIFDLPFKVYLSEYPTYNNGVLTWKAKDMLSFIDSDLSSYDLHIIKTDVLPESIFKVLVENWLTATKENVSDDDLFVGTELYNDVTAINLAPFQNDIRADVYFTSGTIKDNIKKIANSTVINNKSFNFYYFGLQGTNKTIKLSSITDLNSDDFADYEIIDCGFGQPNLTLKNDLRVVRVSFFEHQAGENPKNNEDIVTAILSNDDSKGILEYKNDTLFGQVTVNDVKQIFGGVKKYFDKADIECEILPNLNLNLLSRVLVDKSIFPSNIVTKSCYGFVTGIEYSFDGSLSQKLTIHQAYKEYQGE